MYNCKVKIILENATVAEYYELERILISGKINAKIVPQKDFTTDEMGMEFNELVVLLPLLTTAVVQLRKIIVAYFTYKKTTNKKTSITIVFNDRKVKIDSENEPIPDVNQLLEFLALGSQAEPEDVSCKEEILDE